MRDAMEPEQTHSAEYNRGWADGQAAGLDACQPVIDGLQAALAARSEPGAGGMDGLRRAVDTYRANPVNADDQASSWQALDDLLYACDAALAARSEPGLTADQRLMVEGFTGVRSEPGAEGLDVERLARAMRRQGFGWTRMDVDNAARDIVREYAALAETEPKPVMTEGPASPSQPPAPTPPALAASPTEALD